MADKKKVSHFGLGLLIGALGGALAGLLYAPKSGKENRKEASKRLKDLQKMFSEKEIEKKAKQIFGKATSETKELYLHTTKALLEKLNDAKDKVGSIDKKKYQKLVDDVVSDFKKQTKQSGDVVKKLKNLLVSDWKKLVK